MLKHFKGEYKIKQVKYTNGHAWCLYQDTFGYPRIAILSGDFDDAMNDTIVHADIYTEYNVNTKKYESTFLHVNYNKIKRG